MRVMRAIDICVAADLQLLMERWAFRSRFYQMRNSALKFASIALFAGVSLAATAQQAPDPSHKKGAEASKEAPAPPPDAMPKGDPKSGVLTPPDVDPKMSKTVPDVDPAMANPPPGKVPAPAQPGLPKAQPR